MSGLRSKKKICEKCQKLQYIWKRVYGKPYCKNCSVYLSKDKKKSSSPRPIKSRSGKRARMEKLYSIIRTAFLKRKPMCEAKCISNCTLRATEIHHKRGRIGDLLIDDKYFLSVCHNCHEWIERNPTEAKEQGFSESRLDQNQKQFN